MGIIVLLIGLGVLVFGLVQHLKGKRILAAPFMKTGEIASNPVSPDPKGALSTEGEVIPPAEALLSPASKTPCLYYELKIERLYEKTETTQDGTKTTKGTETLDTIKGGTTFGLDDGTGPVFVDVAKGGDFDNLKEGYKKELNGRGWSSNVQFGEYAYDVPAIGTDRGYTIGFRATEKYVPVEGSLFVLGKLENGMLVKPGWRSMMFSSKGREGLLASTAKKAKFSFIGGGVASVLAIPLMIFGPSIDSGSCPSKLNGTVESCSDNVTKSNEYQWTVAEPGKYQIVVTPPSGKKFPFQPEIALNDAEGRALGEVSGGLGTKAVFTKTLQPGTYEIVVKDAGGIKVKGGFSYKMEIRGPAQAAKPAAVAQGKEEDAAGTPKPDNRPAEDPSMDGMKVCHDGDLLSDSQTCKATITDDTGVLFAWKVKKAGSYHLTIAPQGAKTVKYPSVSVVNAKGKDVAEKEGKGTLTLTAFVKPGQYDIVINDLELEAADFPVDFVLSVSPSMTGKPVASAGGKAKKPAKPAKGKRYKND